MNHHDEKEAVAADDDNIVDVEMVDLQPQQQMSLAVVVDDDLHYDGGHHHHHHYQNQDSLSSAPTNRDCVADSSFSTASTLISPAAGVPHYLLTPSLADSSFSPESPSLTLATTPATIVIASAVVAQSNVKVMFWYTGLQNCFESIARTTVFDTFIFILANSSTTTVRKVK
jgi:hypothetical protein